MRARGQAAFPHLDEALRRTEERHQRLLRSELVRDVAAPATVQSVWTSLTAEMPSLVMYEGAMSVAVNAEYARMGEAVHDGDEVAFLPPVSGG